MDLFDNLLIGLSTALQLKNLGFCLIGVLIGTAIGVLPGIGPLATILMGVVILGEPFTPWIAGGTVLVLAGIWLLTKWR